MESTNVKSSNYQRLFRLKGGILFLISDVFGGYYKNLNCLLTSVNGVWTSYFYDGTKWRSTGLTDKSNDPIVAGAGLCIERLSDSSVVSAWWNQNTP